MMLPEAGPLPACCHRTDRKSTRLNSSHSQISYAVFCLKKKQHGDRVCAYATHRVRMRSEARPCYSTGLRSPQALDVILNATTGSHSLSSLACLLTQVA